MIPFYYLITVPALLFLVYLHYEVFFKQSYGISESLFKPFLAIILILIDVIIIVLNV